MRQLSSCDFCDAGTSLGVYEVGPDTAGAESRRLVLCPDCRDRLDWVLEPFYDAADDGGGAAGEDVTLLGVSDSRDASTSDHGSTPDDGSTPGTDAVDGGADTLDGGPAGASATDDTDGGPVDTPATDDTDGGPVDTPATDADDEGSPGARPAGASTAERGSDDTPPKYRQVMRFLGNRDLPIDRMEAESLASGAYDLDTGEAADIIDTAVERGLLVEDDGKLRPA
jgi:hypothetical protein